MIIVGLGNPGKEYESTRHNIGRIVASYVAKLTKADVFETDGMLRAQKTKTVIGGKKVVIVLPDTFMNLSGKAVMPLIKSPKDLTKLVVMYDDLDLARGTFKISFNRSSGGHNGVQSIIKAVKSEAFIRVRIGISPTTTSGKLKKPLGEEKVGKWILGVMKDDEKEGLKKLSKTVLQALEMIVEEGLPKAMSIYNGK